MDKSSLNHILKFEVWKKSMMVRYFIEGIFTIVITILFQVYLSKFNKYLHKAMEEALKIVRLVELKEVAEASHNHDLLHELTEEIHHEKELLHEELREASHDLEEAMHISFIFLFFPLNFLFRRYFLSKTWRQVVGINPTESIEFV